MTLYLTCGLCGRKQADGLLSRGYWGHLEIVPHGTLRACPTCKEHHGSEWEAELRASVSLAAPKPQQGIGQSLFR
jgi:hypothetical protein